MQKSIIVQFDYISHEIPFTGVDNVGKIIRAFKLTFFAQESLPSSH